MIHLHWFLPTAGDDRHVVGFGDTKGQRGPTRGYLSLVAQAAEQLGFEAVLTPTGTYCEDAWLTTASLLSDTQRLRFLVAFRPGSVTPTLAAQMAATYQRLSNGRLLLNVVTGGDAAEQRRFGDWLEHDERYRRTDEFLTVLRGAWSGAPFDFSGHHYEVAGATVSAPPDPIPPIFFGGASAAAEEVAVRHADVYLTWGEPPAMVAERVERISTAAAARGRTLRFGIRLHVISRDSSADAWAETERMVAKMDPASIAAAQAQFAVTESVGQQRMASLHHGLSDRLEIAPNLWAGYGLVRGGAGTALVGSHHEVADRIAEYHQLGFDHFILSGQPHLEEAYWFGEGVIPELRRRGLLAADAGSEPTGDDRTVVPAG
jgi:alkanesulfonate monooxygenase